MRSFSNNLKISVFFLILSLICALILGIEILSAYGEKATEPIVKQKFFRYDFFGTLETRFHIVTFYLNGSLLVDTGAQFYISPPKFQPNGSYTIDIFDYETYVLQKFNVLDGTLNLSVYYDFTNFESNNQVKIRMVGATTDEDAEIEYEFENPKSAPIHNTTTSYQIGNIVYDWSDLIGETDFYVSLNRLKIKFDASFDLDPSLICEVYGNRMLYRSYQRKMFYANGRHWIFYCDQDEGSTYRIFYRSSTDGITWTDRTKISTNIAHWGGIFSVWFNGTYVSYGWDRNGLKYRMGTPYSNGTIKWKTSEQTILGSTDTISRVFVSTDSDGYPYVLTLSNYPYNLTVYKSEFKNGTWKTATGFPFYLKNETSYGGGSIIPLSSNKMYVVYGSHNGILYGRLYDGSSWGNEETITTDSVTIVFHSVVADSNGNIRVIYKTSNHDIKYNVRPDGGSWETPNLIYDGEISDLSPQLSISGNDYFIYYAIDNKIFCEAHYSNATILRTEIDAPYGFHIKTLLSNYDASNENRLFYIAYDDGTSNLYFEEPNFGSLPIPIDVTGTNPTTQDEDVSFTTPKKVDKLPMFGLFVVIGGVGIFGVSALWNKLSRPSRRKPRGVHPKESPKVRGVTPKTSRGYTPRKPRRSKRTGRFV